MLSKTGIVSLEMLEKILPEKERQEKGAFALFECFEKIPCNPCYTSCKVGAVDPLEDINDIPIVDYEKCSGCGICVSECPGLAVFIIDKTYSETEAAIKLPYELLPLPEVGQEVDAKDREGKVIGKARVVKVQNSKALNKTNVITIAVPKEHALLARSISLEVDS